MRLLEIWEEMKDNSGGYVIGWWHLDKSMSKLEKCGHLCMMEDETNNHWQAGRRMRKRKSS